jgi:hypothetical protein
MRRTFMTANGRVYRPRNRKLAFPEVRRFVAEKRQCRKASSGAIKREKHRGSDRILDGFLDFYNPTKIYVNPGKASE